MLSVRVLGTGADNSANIETEGSEVVARLRAMIRRYARGVSDSDRATVIRTGSLVIDGASQFVRKHGATVQLTRTV